MSKTKDSKLLPPFSYFGGKRAVAPKIIESLGEISNYIEPFCGSLSILLSNLNPPKIETVNDTDGGLVNFWRCVKKNPEELAKYCDYPISELDLHARHKWLINQLTDEFIDKLNSDPDYCDLKIGGYWIYGQCGSIPGNWLQNRGLNALPMLSSAGSRVFGLKHDPKIWFETLQNRLRRVRICCRDWKDLITSSITYKIKVWLMVI